jgi:hypothetical protein
MLQARMHMMPLLCACVHVCTALGKYLVQYTSCCCCLTPAAVVSGPQVHPDYYMSQLSELLSVKAPAKVAA